MVTVTDPIRAAIETVCDPEIPVLTIADLGLVRDIRQSGDETIVTITPTYSGCPAMDTIAADIVTAATAAGASKVTIETVLSPAWTTAWMSEDGKRKLAEFGIAPPGSEPVCPQCSAANPRTISHFGSTACKALMVCTICKEPFDWFKDL